MEMCSKALSLCGLDGVLRWRRTSPRLRFSSVYEEARLKFVDGTGWRSCVFIFDDLFVSSFVMLCRVSCHHLCVCIMYYLLFPLSYRIMGI